MKAGKARIDGRTMEQRVYAWLRYEVARPATAREIADEFELAGGPRGAVRGVLRRLMLKKCVAMSGPRSAALWTATTVRPVDLRGLTPGSRTVLVKIADQRRQGAEPKRKTYRSGISLHELWTLPTQRREL